jgi:O-antigen/teichoic acid export membrane protein
MMGVSFYTVRVVLNVLGAVDYGIYNVVGGIVITFSFLSAIMASASQRFFAFELGLKNHDRLKKIFSMTMTIYIIIAVVILLLGETVGLWFLNNQMTIPVARLEAANWIYQFSILSFMMTMFTIPYDATIIAHERMNVYAWVSIVEVLLKLCIVYLLPVFSVDKLKIYAVLTFGVITVVTFIYRSYSIRKFEECRYRFIWDKALFYEIVSFSGWNLFGALANIFNGQGTNLILNVFFGPIVNTARGIAFQLNGSINQFVFNFLTATNPQIIKYHAQGENEEMLKLVFQSSKISFMMLFVLTMPVLLETDYIFKLWLVNTPKYVVLFVRLTLIVALIDSLSYPLMVAAQATGKIKKYQMVVGGTMLLNLPISYFFFKFSFPPQTILYLAIFSSAICLLLRLLMLKKMINLSIESYVNKVLLRLLFAAIFAYIIPLFLVFELSEGTIKFIIIGFIGVVSSIFSFYYIGFNKNERAFSIQFIKNKFSKK